MTAGNFPMDESFSSDEENADGGYQIRSQAERPGPWATKSLKLIAVTILACIAVFTLCFTMFRLPEDPRDVTEVGSWKRGIPADSSPCGYRDYPWPDHNSGLPFLADVFASHDAQWVYFVAVNRGACLQEWKEADRFDAEDGRAHRFVCSFDESTHVFTEFIHAAPGHANGDVIRCRIPEQYQHLVVESQSTTTLHVDLHAIENLEAKPMGVQNIRPFPSMDIRDTPMLEQLPICNAIHNTTTNVQQQNLTVFTRIKSKYGIREDNFESTVLPYKQLLGEWISYHEGQGADHFIFAVNDEDPEPLREILQPYMDSGLVTFVWFPLKDCLRDIDGWEGYSDARGQHASSLSVLHRYGHLTEYFAHMDVDEFFISFNSTVLDFVRSVDDKYDAVEFKPSIMAPCNGAYVQANQTIMSKWRCWTGIHYADVKLIFRPTRIWSFFVHYPLVTWDGSQPKTYRLNDEEEGLLAHYRRADVNRDTWQSDGFEGLVVNEHTNRMHFMDRFVGEADDPIVVTTVKPTPRPTSRHTRTKLEG